MMNLRRAGVYKIENKFTGMVYIGASSNIAERWHRHKYALRHKADNAIPKLARAWEVYGEDAFFMEPLEFVDRKDEMPEGQCLKYDDYKEELIEREQYYMDLYDSYHGGYNCSPTAGSNKGCKYPPELGAGVTKRMKGNTFSQGEKNGHAKLSEGNVMVIRLLSQHGIYSAEELAKSFDVSCMTIRRIIRRITWKHLPEVRWSDKGLQPEQYLSFVEKGYL